jgi:hypothetical protein
MRHMCGFVGHMVNVAPFHWSAQTEIRDHTNIEIISWLGLGQAPSNYEVSRLFVFARTIALDCYGSQLSCGGIGFLGRNP